MTDNYNISKEWLDLAFKNIEKVIKFYKIEEYAATVFRIQLSIEQLLKSLIFLLGLKFRKTREPSKILDSIEKDEKIKIEKKYLNKIKKIAKIANNIEQLGTATRYGEIIDGKLVTPEERYNKKEALIFLNDLGEILIKLIELLENLYSFKNQIDLINKHLNEIKELISDEQK
ncbi:MAG: HEPN domain-containing protein [Promethearchaeota archaeon]|nr:MAG: HEPN domain-containing protein [Candidatus Lokiarchaeota archaeon]